MMNNFKVGDKVYSQTWNIFEGVYHICVGEVSYVFKNSVEIKRVDGGCSLGHKNLTKHITELQYSELEATNKAISELNKQIDDLRAKEREIIDENRE